MEQHEQYQRSLMTTADRVRARIAHRRARHPQSATTPPPSPPPPEIDSKVYDTKVRVNHWHDTMMEHKKIYYAAELKMYKLELALANYSNSDKLRWSVRHREMANMNQHAEQEAKAARRTPEPAFGYVPITRRLKSEQPHGEANQSSVETIGCNEDEDEMRSTISATLPVKDDVIPAHSEDYKPFSGTPSIYSYMYHLRQIYGK